MESENSDNNCDKDLIIDSKISSNLQNGLCDTVDAGTESSKFSKVLRDDQGDSVDAKPSEVDAKPIIKAEPSGSEAAVEIQTEKDSRYYVMEGVKKVIIFNHKKFQQRLNLGDRKGTEVDVRSIQKTFKSLDWEIDLHNDLTVAQIRNVILKDVQLSERPISALAIFLLSHGEDNGTIFASDYPFRVDQDILVKLTADQCPGLAGKPKLIFVQACQGQATDSGSTVEGRRRRHTSTDATPAYKIPNYADFLIFQASFWDHYSFRSPETGSWFIQSLCSAIDKSNMDESLLEILLDVSRHVAVNKISNVPGRNHLDKKKQIPLMYSTMIRQVYLKCDNPDKVLRSVSSKPDEVGILNDSVEDMRITKNDNERGSQRSLLPNKMRDKDCSCM